MDWSLLHLTYSPRVHQLSYFRTSPFVSTQLLYGARRCREGKMKIETLDLSVYKTSFFRAHSSMFRLPPPASFCSRQALVEDRANKTSSYFRTIVHTTYWPCWAWLSLDVWGSFMLSFAVPLHVYLSDNYSFPLAYLNLCGNRDTCFSQMRKKRVQVRSVPFVVKEPEVRLITFSSESEWLSQRAPSASFKVRWHHMPCPMRPVGSFLFFPSSIILNYFDLIISQTLAHRWLTFASLLVSCLFLAWSLLGVCLVLAQYVLVAWRFCFLLYTTFLLFQCCRWETLYTTWEGTLALTISQNHQ